LNNSIEHYNEDILRLQVTHDQLTEEITQLENLDQLRQDEINQQDLKMKKYAYAIKWLKEQRDAQCDTHGAKVHADTKQDRYRAMPGDKVDEMISDYIHANLRQKVQFDRIGLGWYLFGTRRVFARINAGKLVIRVAGGWESLHAFVERHTEEELHKTQKQIE
jgi:hypothetical protein